MTDKNKLVLHINYKTCRNFGTPSNNCSFYDAKNIRVY
jgi:hypothetical protein